MRGIERETDKLGRVVIPMEFRKQLGIEFESKVLIFLSDGEIIIRPQKMRCVLCGEKIEKIKNLQLCDNCISRVKKEL